METNEKLIAVVEIGGDKATQFWARADDRKHTMRNQRI